MEPVRVGVIGCGAISGIYLQNLARFHSTHVVAVADLDLERARTVADQHTGVRALTPEDLLNDPDVELVLNLTVPKAHFGIAKSALGAGKHVYNEKPLTIGNDEARSLLNLAESAELLVGCAPDTFLGSGHQTCRRLIDSGAIGEPIAGHAFMLCRGHETWHPSPEFYYEAGGGPMLDMGPYYVTALLNLMGGVTRTCGLARASFPTRTITSQPKAGKVVKVETDTHISGEIEFESGAIVHLATSFDVFGPDLPNIIIYGSEGTMIVPDPNGFGGKVLVRRGHSHFEDVPLDAGFAENTRGLGVLDMAYALRGKQSEFRTSGQLAYHALQVMNSFSKSSHDGCFVPIEKLASRPSPLPAGEYLSEIED